MQGAISSADILENVKMNILVIRFTSLGDLVTLELAFRAIRHFFPQAKITFLTSGIGKGLYEDSGYFDECIVFSRSYRAIWSALRGVKFDTVFNLQSNRPSHMLMMGIGAENIFNSSSSWWQKFLGIKGKTKWPPQLLKQAGIDPIKVDSYFGSSAMQTIVLPYNQESVFSKSIRTFFEGRPVIAVATGASERWESKKWGDERFEQLVGELLEKGYGIVLIGSKLEEAAGESICTRYPEVMNLIAKTSLAELKAVLASVDLLIGNDSGPAHLAGGVGTNTLSIFGSTDIKHCVAMMPYRGRHEYLVAEPRLSCQPCYKSKCPTQHECMEAVSVRDVVSAVQKILDA